MNQPVPTAVWRHTGWQPVIAHPWPADPWAKPIWCGPIRPNWDEARALAISEFVRMYGFDPTRPVTVPSATPPTRACVRVI